MIKNNLVITVAIVWKSNEHMRLITSVYDESSGVKNYDEALGRAITDQKKELDNPDSYTLAMNNCSSSWNAPKATDLSCLRFC